jgi:hypothetical protein
MYTEEDKFSYFAIFFSWLFLDSTHSFMKWIYLESHYSGLNFSCVALDKSLNFSRLRFFLCKVRIISIFLDDCEDSMFKV